MTVLRPANNDQAALEETVGFVRRKVERILIRIVGDSEAPRYFGPVSEMGVVREGEFAKTKQRKEASEQDGEEERIIMGWVDGIVINHHL